MRRLNRQFKIVFQPKNRKLFQDRRRFGVGAYSLYKYVGRKNAETALRRALSSLEDKCTVKLRKCGRIDFYFK